ncbi:F-box/kelch-repeat protein At3g06240-like [Papaver somniferum]|nr:F-box/kelch-repeat protein At3g06240-like [Papaver somniferum]
MVPMYSVNWCHSLPVASAHNNNEQSDVEIIDSPFYLADYYSTHASCDGLILMYNPFEFHGVILWNPSTKEIMEIPEPIYSGSIDPFDEPTIMVTVSTQYGLGYSPILDDYKIVKTETYFKNDEWVCNGCYVYIYSLGSDSWKTIPGIIPYDLLLGGKSIKPVMYNGALHWIGSSCISLKQGRELSIAISIVIISFDIENDTFKEVPLTPELQESLSYDHTTILYNDSRLIKFQESTDIFLGTFHGYLSIVQGGDLDLTRNNNGDVSIWVMKEYGVKESWTKMFSVSVQSMERSVKCSTMMTIIDFRDGFLYLKDKTSLVVYDAEHKTCRVVYSGDLSIEGLSFEDTYVESLVSLNSGMYLG